jgi:hypothetical protein
MEPRHGITPNSDLIELIRFIGCRLTAAVDVQVAAGCFSIRPLRLRLAELEVERKPVWGWISNERKNTGAMRALQRHRPISRERMHGVWRQRLSPDPRWPANACTAAS